MKIELATDRLKKEFETVLDPRLQFVLHALADNLGGARVTCISRDPEENRAVGGVNKSFHIPDSNGIVKAVDFNPIWSCDKPDAWRLQAKAYIDRSTTGIQVIIHKGTALHCHMEIDPLPGHQVELVA